MLGSVEPSSRIRNIKRCASGLKRARQEPRAYVLKSFLDVCLRILREWDPVLLCELSAFARNLFGSKRTSLALPLNQFSHKGAELTKCCSHRPVYSLAEMGSKNFSSVGRGVVCDVALLVNQRKIVAFAPQK
jgi:hypothetical protein